MIDILNLHMSSLKPNTAYPGKRPKIVFTRQRGLKSGEMNKKTCSYGFPGIYRFRLQYASMTKSFNDISKKNTRFAGACHIRMCSNWSVWTEWTLLILRAGRFSHTSNGHCHGGGSNRPMIETIKTQIGPLGAERTWFAGAERTCRIFFYPMIFSRNITVSVGWNVESKFCG